MLKGVARLGSMRGVPPVATMGRATDSIYPSKNLTKRSSYMTKWSNSWFQRRGNQSDSRFLSGNRSPLGIPKMAPGNRLTTHMKAGRTPPSPLYKKKKNNGVFFSSYLINCIMLISICMKLQGPSMLMMTKDYDM